MTATEEIGNYLSHVYITDIGDKTMLAINAEDKWSAELPKFFKKEAVVSTIHSLCHQYDIDYITADNVDRLAKEAIKDYHRKTPKSEEAEQPKQPRKIVCDTLEGWHTGLNERYQAIKRFAEKEFNGVWPVIEFGLAIRCILNIRDITLPFAGVVLGKPSSNKTLGLEMLRGTPHTFYTDAFTPKSFVSHYTVADAEELAKVDLLPKIKDSVLIAPELGPIFAKKDDDLVELLGILTRVLDGGGYESDSGVHGHRGYSGEYMFTLLGAAVDIPRKVYRYLGTLGPKLYFLRLPEHKTTEQEYLDQLDNNSFVAKKTELQKLVQDYLLWLDGAPIVEEINGHPKIQWAKDQKEALELIVRYCLILSKLRGTIPTWETHGSQGTEYAYAMPVTEEPKRAMVVLHNLAKGHALSEGRTSVNLEDIPLVENVVLSTAPRERVEVFRLLIENGGTLTTDQVMQGLSTSKPTALKTMTEMRVLGLVTMQEGEGSNPSSIELKTEYAWILCKEKLPQKSGKGEGDKERDAFHGGQNSLHYTCPICTFKVKYSSEALLKEHMRVGHGQEAA